MNRPDKLTLNRETVRRLSDLELEQVQGGQDEMMCETAQCLSVDTCACFSDDDAPGET